MKCHSIHLFVEIFRNSFLSCLTVNFFKKFKIKIVKNIFTVHFLSVLHEKVRHKIKANSLVYQLTEVKYQRYYIFL